VGSATINPKSNDKVTDNMKICLIDDNPSITGMMSKMLRLEGHEVEVINDSKDGLSALENNNYDAVLLDIAMPEFSGIDIINSLNESGKLKKHNIGVITASVVSDAEMNHLRESGVKEILKKPVDNDELIGFLDKMSKN